MTGAAILLLAAVVAVPVRAADLTAGKAIFARCRICHSVAANAPATVGPDLHGLFDRKAGSRPDYDYSPAMRHSGIVWTDATLTRFLRDPKTFIPGNKMGFPGIDDPAAIRNLLAFLRQATGRP
jgi:cytochrome c